MNYKYYKEVTLNSINVKVYYIKKKSLKRSIRYSYKKEDNSLYFCLPYYFTSLKEIDNILINDKERVIKLISRTNNISKDYLNYYLGEKLDVYDSLIFIDNKYLTLNEFYDYKEKEICQTLYKFFKEEEERLGTKKHIFKVKLGINSYYGINYPKKDTIILNAILIHFSEPIIKSVIDHELMHDTHHGHNKEFYASLLNVCPNYYELDSKLKKGEVK